MNKVKKRKISVSVRLSADECTILCCALDEYLPEKRTELENRLEDRIYFAGVRARVKEENERKILQTCTKCGWNESFQSLSEAMAYDCPNCSK